MSNLVVNDEITEELLKRGWTIEEPAPASHAWAWIIVTLLIILFIIFIFFRKFWEDKQNFGIYGEAQVGQCLGGHFCTELGQRVIIQECQPHPVTGRGCLIPLGDRAGDQSYESLITIEKCRPSCVSSLWREVTTPNEPCLISNGSTDPETRVSAEMVGVKTRRFRCVSHDREGINRCTYNALTEMVGPSDQSGLKSTLQTSVVGDEVTLTSSR